jgi:hypothetical protein
MDLIDAVRALGRLGSANDPIMFRGEEVIPEDLPFCLEPTRSAASVRLAYWSVRSGRARLITRGTLSGMLRDRKRQNPPFKGKHAVKRRCPHCKRRM